MRTIAGKLVLALILSWALAACGAGQPSPEVTVGEGDKAEEHFQRGTQFMENGQFEEAIGEYEAALAAEPDNVPAMINLGVAYYQTGRFQQAIAQYQKALDITPDAGDIHSNLAATYVQLGNLEAALQEYQAAVTLQPDLAQAHFGLGVVYIELEKNAQAIEALERFQELDTGQDPMATDLARQYLEQLKGP